MYEELRRAIDELRNDKAGWVTRRDAAEVLGKVARQALAALDAHRADPDRDVRKAVERALERVSAPPPSEMDDRTFSLKELARGCEKQDERTVSPHGEGFSVVVRLAEERTQTVYIMPHRRRDGTSLVRMYSYCGDADPEVMAWALRSNSKLVHCAFAVQREDGADRIVLVNSLVHGKASPPAVKASVKEIAFYADWLEKKLTGLDDL